MSQIEKKIQLPDPLKADLTEIKALCEEIRLYENDLNEALFRYTTKLGDLLNSGLKFTDNNDVYITSVTTALANAELEVDHNLKRIPNGYIVVSVDKAACIYDGSSAWTATHIYIKSNAATTAVKLLIF